jgi:hypothetical protein
MLTALLPGLLLSRIDFFALKYIRNANNPAIIGDVTQLEAILGYLRNK